MSWLFGRKKHQKESPTDSAEEELQTDQNEGFVHVKKAPAPPPPVQGSGSSQANAGLYPDLDGTGTYPTNPQASLNNRSNQEAPHYLSGVPFKLCRQLERDINDDLEIDKLRIGEIVSFIDRIDGQNFDYTFELEQSVIAEMESQNGGDA